MSQLSGTASCNASFRSPGYIGYQFDPTTKLLRESCAMDLSRYPWSGECRGHHGRACRSAGRGGHRAPGQSLMCDCHTIGRRCQLIRVCVDLSAVAHHRAVSNVSARPGAVPCAICGPHARPGPPRQPAPARPRRRRGHHPGCRPHRPAAPCLADHRPGRRRQGHARLPLRPPPARWPARRSRPVWQPVSRPRPPRLPPRRRRLARRPGDRRARRQREDRPPAHPDHRRRRARRSATS